MPGKPLMDFAGKTGLARHLERFSMVKGVDEVCLATSKDPKNQPLIQAAEDLGIRVYQGGDEDIVERFIGVGRMCGADAMVRVGCDKPLFSYELLEQSLCEYSGEDYIYFRSPLTPGLAHEILSLSALEKTHEHYRGTAIAQYIREHPQLFSIKPLQADPIFCRPEYRLALDIPEDYDLLKQVFEALDSEGSVVSAMDVLAFLDDNPELALINKYFEDKNCNVYSRNLDSRPVFSVVLGDDGKYVVHDRAGKIIQYDRFVEFVDDRKKWN
ncbi:MAG: hypothetical protein JEY79_07300 [Pseudodesulfovibrio sp.]|nr:hypothetical protein [Pseudodesulfovibrio sp.]